MSGDADSATRFDVAGGSTAIPAQAVGCSADSRLRSRFASSPTLGQEAEYRDTGIDPEHMPQIFSSPDKVRRGLGMRRSRAHTWASILCVELPFGRFWDDNSKPNEFTNYILVIFSEIPK